MAAATATRISTIGLHQGLALAHVADHYPTLMECVMEAIQNSIDAKAQRVWVKIDLQKMNIAITDDGNGVSSKQFEEALSTVCKSVKAQGSLGQFGIGLIAFLGKCEYFRFISCPRFVSQGYLQWTFNTKEIMEQEGTPEINCETLINYTHARVPSSKKQGNRREVPWRTGIFVHKFDRKKIVRAFSLETLEHDVVNRYGIPMRHLNTVVQVELVQPDGERLTKNIRATSWSGIPLPEEVATAKDAGKVIIRVFRTRRSKKVTRAGVVSLGEEDNPFRLPWRQFAKHAAYWLKPETDAGLSSGLFEGEILSTGIKLNPNRRHFNEDQSLVDFCEMINDWWQRVGQQYYENARDEAKSERYESLAKRSLAVVESMLKDPDLGGMIRKVVKSFKVGSIGPCHVDLPDRKIIGDDDLGTTVQGTTRPGNKPSGEGRDEPVDEPIERPDHIPLVVEGPSGKPRRAVRSNSLGIHIAHDEMPGVDKLWEFNRAKGQLIFNVRHPIYEKVEDNDNAQMKLMEQILFQVLILQSFDEEWQPIVELFLEQYHRLTPFLLLKADSAAGRGPGRRFPKS